MSAAPPPLKLDHRGLPPPKVRLDYGTEIPFWVFLLVSLLVFAGGTMLGIYARWGESPAVIQIDLDYLEGVENEPPPLGTPDAGGPAAPEEQPKPPEPEQPPPPPEPEQPPPPPDPIPEPVQPDFPKPEEKPQPTPVPSTPRPRASTPKPAGTPKPAVVPNPKTAPGGTGTGETANPNAKPGPRGDPNGVAGGKGGQKGGFISRPNPTRDYTMISRNYTGTGRATVQLSGGRIVDVQISTSTGNPYLDSHARAWIRSNWKPAPGAEGTYTFPVIYKP